MSLNLGRQFPSEFPRYTNQNCTTSSVYESYTATQHDFTSLTMERKREWKQCVFEMDPRMMGLSLCRGAVVYINSSSSKYHDCFGWIAKLDSSGVKATVALPVDSYSMEKPKMVSYKMTSLLALVRSDVGCNNEVRDIITDLPQYHWWHLTNNSDEVLDHLRKENRALKQKVSVLELRLEAMKRQLHLANRANDSDDSSLSGRHGPNVVPEEPQKAQETEMSLSSLSNH